MVATGQIGSPDAAREQTVPANGNFCIPHIKRDMPWRVTGRVKRFKLNRTQFDNFWLSCQQTVRFGCFREGLPYKTNSLLRQTLEQRNRIAMNIKRRVGQSLEFFTR